MDNLEPQMLNGITFRSFILFSASGSALCFLPLLFFDRMNSWVVTSTASDKVMNSHIIALGLFGSISVCLYLATEDVFALAFVNRNSVERVVRLILLSDLIIPYTVLIVLIGYKQIESLITCVSCSQMIFLYSTYFMMLYLSGQPIWSQKTLFTALSLLNIGYLFTCIGIFVQNRVILWISIISRLLTLALYFFKSYKWLTFQFQKNRSKRQPNELICNYYVVGISVHLMINLVTSSILYEYGEEHSYHATTFCTHILNNTALAVVCVMLQNHVIKKRLENMQVEHFICI